MKDSLNNLVIYSVTFLYRHKQEHILNATIEKCFYEMLI